MNTELQKTISLTVKDLFGIEVTVELNRTDPQFGDYATNIALQLAKQLGQNPRAIAEQLRPKLLEMLAEQVTDITIAGPGFLNFTLTDATLVDIITRQPAQIWKDKVVVAEYSDPNPFKVLHAGHLYTSVVGDAIANLFEVAGATVHRVNYGGDVGLHAAKTMWAIVKRLSSEDPAGLNQISESERSEWMATAYVEGTTAYESDEQAKAEIITYNQRIYAIHSEHDHESLFAQIYWTCREWSYDYFNAFYDRIGTQFEKYYPESETVGLGLQTVQSHIGDVYQKSDGAVVFSGEQYGLHTRVFINSNGLPTYETKEVGLIMKKWADYHFDRSIIITGNDIIEYMKVVLKSIEQYLPDLPPRTTHLTHGMVKLQGGTKMSSRKGNFLRAVDVLNAASAANQAQSGQDNQSTVLGAVKYAFLKNRVGGDLIYDPAESVSLEGNSGPYLQYAHARAKSILRKAEVDDGVMLTDLQTDERSLVRKLGEYAEIVDKAVHELMPHHICTYLYELAQEFNRFYEHNRVIDDPRQAIRLKLVSQYADTLKVGLGLLGITAPEQM